MASTLRLPPPLPQAPERPLGKNPRSKPSNLLLRLLTLPNNWTFGTGARAHPRRVPKGQSSLHSQILAVFSEPSATRGMKAAVIRRYGPPSVLQLENDWPQPARKPGEVLVKIHAAGTSAQGGRGPLWAGVRLQGAGRQVAARAAFAAVGGARKEALTYISMCRRESSGLQDPAGRVPAPLAAGSAAQGASLPRRSARPPTSPPTHPPAHCPPLESRGLKVPFKKQNTPSFCLPGEQVLGADLAGEVLEADAGSAFRPGQRVFACSDGARMNNPHGGRPGGGGRRGRGGWAQRSAVQRVFLNPTCTRPTLTFPSCKVRAACCDYMQSQRQLNGASQGTRCS